MVYLNRKFSIKTFPDRCMTDVTQGQHKVNTRSTRGHCDKYKKATLLTPVGNVVPAEVQFGQEPAAVEHAACQEGVGYPVDEHNRPFSILLVLRASKNTIQYSTTQRRITMQRPHDQGKTLRNIIQQGVLSNPGRSCQSG